MNNDLINIIAAIAFPFIVIVFAWLVFRNERIKAKKPTINDRYNQSRNMASPKDITAQDCEHLSQEELDELSGVIND